MRHPATGPSAGMETLSARESRNIFGTGQLAAISETVQTIRQATNLSNKANKTWTDTGGGVHRNDRRTHNSTACVEGEVMLAPTRRLLVFVNHPSLTPSQQRKLQVSITTHGSLHE